MLVIERYSKINHSSYAPLRPHRLAHGTPVSSLAEASHRSLLMLALLHSTRLRIVTILS
jgi:hypothetical protein